MIAAGVREGNLRDHDRTSAHGRRSQVPGILDDAKKIRNRAFDAAAQRFRRIGASDGSPSSFCSKTCTGQTARVCTFSPALAKSVGMCRC